MTTSIKFTRTEDGQKVNSFTGEGAYHGSSKYREKAIPSFEEEEARPLTLIDGTNPYQEFLADFPNDWRIVKQFDEPTQEQIRDDGITFVWAPFDLALREAGPLTKSVLLAMEPHLEKKKKFVYIDSKIQFFRKGDVPVDSKLWHVDGSITVRDSRATRHAVPMLHDMLARQNCATLPPMYMAYQSSSHCATQFLTEPLIMTMPACIPSFDLFDMLVEGAKPSKVSQPPATILKFDGFSIHRAVPASADGWRLWIRCTETDREIKVDEAAVNCYGSVFRANT